jgi:transcriptional regulator with XRE-family HTH domain
MLIWARVESGLDQKSVSERLGLKDPERLEAWETSRQKPTLREAEKLATIYKRPLGIFFLLQPPATTILAAEYRRLPGVKPGNESPALRLALRQLRRHREIALELSEENGAPIPRLQLKAQLVNEPERIG